MKKTIFVLIAMALFGCEKQNAEPVTKPTMQPIQTNTQTELDPVDKLMPLLNENNPKIYAQNVVKFLMGVLPAAELDQVSNTDAIFVKAEKAVTMIASNPAWSDGAFAQYTKCQDAATAWVMYAESRKAKTAGWEAKKKNFYDLKMQCDLASNK